MTRHLPLNCAEIRQVKVRPFVPEDRPALLAVINVVCAEGRWMCTRCYEPTPAWEHALDQPNCTCHRLLVTTVHNRIIGWCRVFPESTSAIANVGIGLLPAYRNRGWGTLLLRSAVSWACQAGFERLCLTVRNDNGRAQYLFRKFGFVPVSLSASEWIVMELWLKHW